MQGDALDGLHEGGVGGEGGEEGVDAAGEGVLL